MTEKRKLSEIEFPVVFKICINPGFYEDQLNKAGYSKVGFYFDGISKYNDSIIGWAGHTEDGGVYGNVTGKATSITDVLK